MRKVMKVCFSVFMSVMVLLGNCSFAAIGNSSARSTYLELEKNSIEAMKKVIAENEVLFNMDFNTVREEFEVYGENLPGDYNNLKLKATGENDSKSNYQYAKVSLGSKEFDKLSFEMILKDKTLMLQAPEIYEKHISIDFSKLKEICEKFDIEVTEEEINEFTNLLFNIQKESILSKQDEAYLKKIAPKYLNKISPLMSEKHFIMDNNSKIEYDTNLVTCKSVSYEVTMDEIINTISVLAKEIRNDQKLIDIIVRVINTSSSEQITVEEFEAALDEISQMLGQGTEELKDFKFVSTLYYNTQKEILKRELKKVMISLNEEMPISLTTIKGNYYALDLGELKIIDNVTKGINNEEHNITTIIEGINYDYNYETNEIIETPYVETENYKMLIENFNENNTIVTLSKEGVTEKIIIKINEKELTPKKVNYSFEFVWDTVEVDYKIFVNYSIEKDIKITQKVFNNPEIDIYKMSKEALMNEFQNNEDQIVSRAESIFRDLFPTLMMQASEIVDKSIQEKYIYE